MWLLHTQCRENFRSMRQFTEKVFSISKQLRSVGKVIDDDELKGILYCGNDADLYAIQIDKWTSADEDKYTSTHIANELIILEKEHSERSGETASVSAARALLVRKGYTVNATAASAPASAPTPFLAPAPAPAPAASHPPGPLCTYCSKPNHTADVCRSRRRDLQAQIQAIDALTLTPNARGAPAPTKPSHTAAAQGPPTVALAAVTAEPDVPPPLPAEVPSHVDEYFKKNTVPSGNSGGNLDIVVGGGERRFINYDILRDKSSLIPLYNALQGHCAVRHKAELHREFHTFHNPKESDNTVVVVEQQ